MTRDERIVDTIYYWQIMSKPLNQAHVLVTGAAGFIGSHLVDRLLAEGARVTGVDNFLTGRRENIAHLEGKSKFNLIEGDVCQPPATYLPADFKPDYVLHFASPASPPRYQEHPVETYQVNAFGTHYLLDYLKKNNSEAVFLFASTSEVYGDPEQHPQTESYWGNVNPNGVRSCYDEAKRLGETICGVFHRDLGMDTRIVRVFNTYGPRIDPDDGRVIPNLISQALQHEPLTIYGDGMQTRSYCYVDDLVEGIIRFATHPEGAGHTINLGNPEEFTILETADLVRELTEQPQLELEYRSLPQDDPTRRQPDIIRAQRLLNWQPKTSFRDGLAKTIEFFKED